MSSIGLIAGNGALPLLFAKSAKEQGLSVVGVAHVGETDSALEDVCDALTWVRVGQLGKIVRAFKDAKVSRAVMAGGIGHARALTEARPDWEALKLVTSLRGFRDDAFLRAIASFFESKGISIVAPTDFLSDLLAPEGVLAGPPPTSSQLHDVQLGVEVADLLGRADVGQTVVVKNGRVLALEALEGTDETIRRGARLGGDGVVVVKLCKPGQDLRFDLPAVGERTIEVMRETFAGVLAVEAGRSLLLDVPVFLSEAQKRNITVMGIQRGSVSRPEGLSREPCTKSLTSSG